MALSSCKQVDAPRCRAQFLQGLRPDARDANRGSRDGARRFSALGVGRRGTDGVAAFRFFAGRCIAQAGRSLGIVANATAIQSKALKRRALHAADRKTRDGGLHEAVFLGGFSIRIAWAVDTIELNWCRQCEVTAPLPVHTLRAPSPLSHAAASTESWSRSRVGKNQERQELLTWRLAPVSSLTGTRHT